MLSASFHFESPLQWYLGLCAFLLLILASCTSPTPKTVQKGGDPIAPETSPAPIEGERLDLTALSEVSEVARTKSLLLARYERNRASAMGIDASTLMAIDSRLAWFAGDVAQADKLLGTLAADNSAALPFVLSERERRSAAMGRWLEAAKAVLEQSHLDLEAGGDDVASERLFGYLMQAGGAEISRELERQIHPDWRAWLEMQQAYRRGQGDLIVWQVTRPTNQLRPPAPEHIKKWLNPDPHSSIKVILPLEGALEAAGDAVLDGVVKQLYSLYPDPQHRPRLDALNSAAYSDARSAYNAAIAQGADLVIGPLTKKEVADLSKLSQFPTPIIALNQSPALGGSVSENWLSFSLAPEDEAGQIAEIAFGHACRNAIVISAADDRGVRLLNAFRRSWSSLGGKIRGQLVIQDLAEANTSMGQLLGSGSSDQRITAIEKAFDLPIDARGRGRSDFECIFMLASDPAIARAWRPLLVFHMTGDSPVYATSAINDGIDTIRNRDLNGVLFAESPGMLPPNRPDRLTRLRALGSDAMLLSQHWHQALATDNWIIRGQTGLLRRHSNGNVERASDLATFDGAKVRHAGIR